MTKAADTRIASVHFSADELELTWQNETYSVYRALWLRDNDPLHRDPQTGQRLISVAQLPAEPRIEKVEQQPAGYLTLHWEDGARSVFSLQWLRTFDRERRISPRPMRMPWMGQPASLFGWADYEQWSALPEVREDWLVRVARDGIAFLRGVPRNEREVLAVAGKIGHPEETARERIENVTAGGVRVHTDQPWRDPVPGFKLLHCLTAPSKGAESLFVDGLAVAERLRARDSDAFALLSQTPVRYRFQDARTDFCVERPMIETDTQGQFRSISYDDGSIAPLTMHPPLLKKFYAAYRRLAELLEEPARFVTYQLCPGDLVIFENTRILHGFSKLTADAGSTVDLQGCYIDTDGLYGTLAVLARRGDKAS